ncbi:hypothetical protein HHX47_DHR3000771 [Lentinula edodes]|nr:hypothetical protein HHX47_DHR3000771 [Lentinula edodes]
MLGSGRSILLFLLPNFSFTTSSSSTSGLLQSHATKFSVFRRENFLVTRANCLIRSKAFPLLDAEDRHGWRLGIEVSDGRLVEASMIPIGKFVRKIFLVKFRGEGVIADGSITNAFLHTTEIFIEVDIESNLLSREYDFVAIIILCNKSKFTVALTFNMLEFERRHNGVRQNRQRRVRDMRRGW